MSVTMQRDPGNVKRIWPQIGKHLPSRLNITGQISFILQRNLTADSTVTIPKCHGATSFNVSRHVSAEFLTSNPPTA